MTLDISDQPLDPDSALDKDKFHRRGFAEAAVKALQDVSGEAGFVISIEGPWGSGKTSVLAMMEKLIEETQKDPSPIFVHFNPWLIGDRDSLLQQYFLALGNALRLETRGERAERAAEFLENYAQVFDLVSYIPSIESVGRILSWTAKAVGKRLSQSSKHHKGNLDSKKAQLEVALRELGQNIYVFIDDLDRLYPQEIYEVVRIVKAVGNLPHVGYVLAMDSTYIAASLGSTNVPQPLSFIDKIVQIRLPLPAINKQMRESMLQEELLSLDAGSREPHFKDLEERYYSVYFHGLRDLLEQPRDILRISNTLRIIEPNLRGEIALPDILALSCIMVKAPRLFEEMKRQPEIFTKGSSDALGLTGEDGEEAAKRLRKRIDEFCEESSNPRALATLVNFLFPNAFGNSYYPINGVDGHIGAPDRLAIALAQTVGVHDVSLSSARKFILAPDSREEIAQNLTPSNALGFFEAVGDIAGHLDASQISDLDALCLHLSQLIDDPTSAAQRQAKTIRGLLAERHVSRAIEAVIVSKYEEEDASIKALNKIAAEISQSQRAISIAAHILFTSKYGDDRTALTVQKDSIEKLALKFASNVVVAIGEQRFWDLANPARVIWTLIHVAPESWPDTRAAFEQDDPSLDKFALEFLKSGFSSDGGQSYALPKDEQLRAVIGEEWITRHAEQRLQDSSLDNITRNAWRSVVEARPIYGTSGKPARDF